MTGNSLAYYQELHERKEINDGLLTEKQHIVVEVKQLKRYHILNHDTS